MNEQDYILRLAHMLDEALGADQLDVVILDNPSDAAEYIEDLKKAFASIKSGVADRKSIEFKASAEFALGDLIDQYENLPRAGRIAFAVDAYNNRAVAGTTYIDIGGTLCCGTALVSFSKGAGKTLIEYVNKKYKNGLACCPISDKVARYYKSIADFEDIGKRENTFLVSAKASTEVKNALRKFGPKLEAMTDDDVAQLTNYIKND